MIACHSPICRYFSINHILHHYLTLTCMTISNPSILLLNLVFELYILCVGALDVCMSVYHVHVCCLWKPEESMGSLVLDFQLFVSYHMGAGVWMQIIWKSRHCFYLLRLLFSSYLTLIFFFYFEIAIQLHPFALMSMFQCMLTFWLLLNLNIHLNLLKFVFLCFWDFSAYIEFILIIFTPSNSPPDPWNCVSLPTSCWLKQQQKKPSPIRYAYYEVFSCLLNIYLKHVFVEKIFHAIYSE